jgi:hypothetical protein
MNVLKALKKAAQFTKAVAIGVGQALWQMLKSPVAMGKFALSIGVLIFIISIAQGGGGSSTFDHAQPDPQGKLPMSRWALAPVGLIAPKGLPDNAAGFVLYRPEKSGGDGKTAAQHTTLWILFAHGDGSPADIWAQAQGDDAHLVELGYAGKLALVSKGVYKGENGAVGVAGKVGQKVAETLTGDGGDGALLVSYKLQKLIDASGNSSNQPAAEQALGWIAWIAAMFLLWGGRGLQYSQKLAGEAVDNLRDFLARGGRLARDGLWRARRAWALSLCVWTVAIAAAAGAGALTGRIGIDVAAGTVDPWLIGAQPESLDEAAKNGFTWALGPAQAGSGETAGVWVRAAGASKWTPIDPTRQALIGLWAERSVQDATHANMSDALLAQSGSMVVKAIALRTMVALFGALAGVAMLLRWKSRRQAAHKASGKGEKVVGSAEWETRERTLGRAEMERAEILASLRVDTSAGTSATVATETAAGSEPGGGSKKKAPRRL